MPNPIQLSDDHLARLEELAGLRGEKGIDHLVEEAIGRFLTDEERRRAALERAFRGLGAPRNADVLAAPARRRG